MRLIETCLIDIDGVIYDFVNHVLPYFNKPSVKESDIKNYDMITTLNLSKKEFWYVLDKEDGIFKDGKIYSWANKLIDLCKTYSKNIAFCSNPGNNPKHWKEKKEFQVANFPDIPLILTQKKNLLSATNIVLIDDFKKNINAFNEGKGIGILFPQYWNDLSNFRKDNASIEYIECTLDDITRIGFEKWKELKE